MHPNFRFAVTHYFKEVKLAEAAALEIDVRGDVVGAANAM
jgi:hypothetical protein